MYQQSINGWLDGGLPGGGEAHTGRLKRAGVQFSGEVRQSVTPPAPPLPALEAKGALVSSLAPKTASGPGVGSCSLSPIHSPPPVCTHPGTQNRDEEPQIGKWEPRRLTQAESQRKSKRPRRTDWSGVGSRERGGSLGALGSQRSGSPQELFSRGKNGFFSSHKVCIVAQRGALMAAKGLRSRDNLGSVSPTPYIDHLPEGHKQSPAAKPLAILRQEPPRLLTNTARAQAPRPGAWSPAGLSSQGCPLHPAAIRVLRTLRVLGEFPQESAAPAMRLESAREREGGRGTGVTLEDNDNAVRE